MSVSVIVLAAGKGTRMNSELPKVLHKVLGKSLLSHALDTLSFSDNTLVVVGHEADLVIDSLPPSIKNILQKDQLGTGHAVSTVINSKVFRKSKSDFTLVVPGDVPGINDGDIELLINKVKTTSSPVGFLTALVEDPFGYGRIVKNNEEIKIVEEKDCSEDEKAINEINSGIYCFKTEFLIENIDNLNTENAQGEFYLTDLIGIANNQKQDIVIVQVDEDSIKGINSMSQLNEVEDLMQKKLIEGFMEQGVYFQDPTSTYIDADVTISSGTKVLANTHLTGSTSINENCTIGPNAQINDSSIGKNSKVVNSVVDQSTIHENGNIGPFAHIRPGSELGEGVKVGSFAETKKSKIGKGSKVPHLAYIGDAELGENVNFSAGSITVNYDGKEKHKTDIKDGAFIGSDVMLVAPVTIGEESMIGAGSVITKDVPPKALGIERNNQKNVEGYVDRKKKK
jgi:bifunctional UDP-N-acetylglucosamine pyrophosphorylase/glucosamine-1-phosphate N-acetyltransferase